jgi:hypothetical protein
MCESLDEFSCSKFPNNNLGVVSRADYIFVTIAYNDPSDVIKMGMKRRLQSQSVTIPNFYDSKKVSLTFAYPSSAALTIKDPV